MLFLFTPSLKPLIGIQLLGMQSTWDTDKWEGSWASSLRKLGGRGPDGLEEHPRMFSLSLGHLVGPGECVTLNGRHPVDKGTQPGSQVLATSGSSPGKALPRGSGRDPGERLQPLGRQAFWAHACYIILPSLNSGFAPECEAPRTVLMRKGVSGQDPEFRVGHWHPINSRSQPVRDLAG